jgi:hypothetical protein
MSLNGAILALQGSSQRSARPPEVGGDPSCPASGSPQRGVDLRAAQPSRGDDVRAPVRNCPDQLRGSEDRRRHRRVEAAPLRMPLLAGQQSPRGSGGAILVESLRGARSLLPSEASWRADDSQDSLSAEDIVEQGRRHDGGRRSLNSDICGTEWRGAGGRIHPDEWSSRCFAARGRAPQHCCQAGDDAGGHPKCGQAHRDDAPACCRHPQIWAPAEIG